jgi:tripartite-type tricarboxylate transporter receptor subunit TctC
MHQNRMLHCFARLIVAPIASMLLAVAAPATAWSQTAAPGGKPITIIVPFATGGATDIVARLVAQQLNARLNTPVIVDNRLGGGGVVGRSAAAKAAADGNTILAMDMSFATAAGLNPNLPYDPKNAFIPLTIAVSVPHVLVVNPSVPAKNMKELIALAKAQPGKLNFGSGGIGTNTHLGSELFKSLAGVNVVHVPYKGAGAVLADLMAGQVQILVSTVTTVLPYIQSGKLRPLMVLSETRSPALPEVPSAPEVGLPGMTMNFWVAFAVPKGTPEGIVEKLNREINAGLNTPEAQKNLTEMGLTKVGGTSAEAAKTVYGEIDRWTALIKQQGIQPE